MLCVIGGTLWWHPSDFVHFCLVSFSSWWCLSMLQKQPLVTWTWQLLPSELWLSSLFQIPGWKSLRLFHPSWYSSSDVSPPTQASDAKEPHEGFVDTCEGRCPLTWSFGLSKEQAWILSVFWHWVIVGPSGTDSQIESGYELQSKSLGW